MFVLCLQSNFLAFELNGYFSVQKKQNVINGVFKLSNALQDLSTLKEFKTSMIKSTINFVSLPCIKIFESSDTDV